MILATGNMSLNGKTSQIANYWRITRKKHYHHEVDVTSRHDHGPFLKPNFRKANLFVMERRDNNNENLRVGIYKIPHSHQCDKIVFIISQTHTWTGRKKKKKKQLMVISVIHTKQKTNT